MTDQTIIRDNAWDNRNHDDPLYRIYRGLDGDMAVVCVQWFDYTDYRGVFYPGAWTLESDAETELAYRTPLWLANNGRISCRRHGGAYLAASIEAAPLARGHVTPLDVWTPLGSIHKRIYLERTGSRPECETCASGNHLGIHKDAR